MLVGEKKDYSRPAIHEKFIKEGKMTIEESNQMIEKANLIDSIAEEWKDEDEKDDKYFGVRE